ncbi:hypothetical protein SISSUDRAFT_730292 [Sistotremastrum suecicum HHB10207 ss-3]|uniref:Uncharacterized protein n=1 Tax=Sistotremastrum suecicum HHB10207 ss-3 TaxID=1314776 RepID=A0A166DIB3_9AGAM|nr:hypothetical protein SISSUDRAFT_730292 [Sistotremastrum suecicum HHB10207 ss-3]
MPHQLSIHLPFLNDTERAKIFGSITDAAARPLSDPVRMGTIAAYSETMKIMLITATLTSIVPIVVSCWMPNWYLGDGQNAVDLRDVRGERVDTAEGEVELDGEEEDDEGGREGERRGDVERGRTR